MEILGFAIPILVAIISYMGTYLNDKTIHKREEELALVNERLEKLYGPLYFLIIASDTPFKTLLSKLGRDHIRPNPSPEDLALWRIWAKNIFMPNNFAQKEIIYQNAYLILEEKPPECFSVFVRHVSEMEALASQWENEDYSENLPVVGYPENMYEYVSTSYLKLKKRQSELIKGKST